MTIIDIQVSNVDPIGPNPMTLDDITAKCNAAITEATRGGISPDSHGIIHKMTPRRLRAMLEHIVTDAELYRGLVRADALVVREAIGNLIKEIEGRFVSVCGC